MRSPLILATRASALALVQANLVKSQLESRWPGLDVRLQKITTSGDAILDRPLRSVGGKGLFVKEIEEALLQKRADFAVHSMKDVPADLPEGLKIGVLLKREDSADVLLSRKYASLKTLPAGAVVGTTSLRRKIQLLKLRPDLKVQDLRGNVDTRIRKMEEGAYDAIILAWAGLKRLGRDCEVTEVLPFIGAPGQGAIGIEYRAEDAELENFLKVLHDEETARRVLAERIILKNLEGGCELPLGAQAFYEEGKLHLKAFLANPSGTVFLEDEVSGDPALAEELGEKLTQLLMAGGAEKVLEEIRKIKK
ncbi:MAG: hydroxymethylbilane synthase [bacterium]